MSECFSSTIAAFLGLILAILSTACSHKDSAVSAPKVQGQGSENHSGMHPHRQVNLPAHATGVKPLGDRDRDSNYRNRPD